MEVQIQYHTIVNLSLQSSINKWWLTETTRSNNTDDKTKLGFTIEANTYHLKNKKETGWHWGAIKIVLSPFKYINLAFTYIM